MASNGHLLDGLRVAPGRLFLRRCVEHLRNSLGAAYVLIGELGGADWQRVEVLATAGDPEGLGEGVRSEMVGTPFLLAIESPVVQTYARGVRERFPEARLLATLDIESYAGMGLADEAGRPMGVVAVLHTRPWHDVERITAELESFRERLTGELSLRRAIYERDGVIDGALTAPDAEIFDELARTLGHVLHTRIAFVSELVADTPHMARTLAIRTNGVAGENFTYDLRETPCGRVYQRSLVFHPRDLQSLYPNDAYLAEQGAEAYMGMAFHDERGGAIGHVGVLHDRPLNERLASQRIFPVFARLARYELLRRRAEQARLALERRLLERQKIESLGMLAGGVAHDFNNLLQAIMGRAGLGLADPALPTSGRPHLEAIKLAAQRGADLVRQLLVFAGRTPSVMAPIDLSDLVRETGTLLGASIPPHVRLCYELADGSPVVNGDPVQLRQLVMNLVLNAVDAIGVAPGSVTLRTGLRLCDRASLDTTVESQGLPEGQYAYLEIEDTGCGMEPEIIGRIFDPFFTTKPSGHGLGLASVRGITQAHRGSLRVTSRPGAGTTFELLLPAAAPPARRHPHDAPAKTAEWQGSGLVLLVDDDDGVRLTTAKMLERLGFTVLPACGGDEALAILDDRGPSVRAAQIDLAMPGMSGEAMLVELRRRSPDLPVVIMSGYSSDRAVERIAGDGRVRFLLKPFDTATLGAAMRELLDPLADAAP